MSSGTDDGRRHRAEMALLGELLDLDPAERRRRLEELRQTDPVTAASLAELIAAHDRAPEFLDDPAVPDDRDGVAAGSSFGPFEVLREIGHGGMGTVWLGVRKSHEFTQYVAIKVLRRDLGAAAVERFRDERRMLAGLSHPYIAHLVDGGTTSDGRPYLAMEFVDGRSITAYADHHGLDHAARLALIAKVCAAVQYAHQNLIVHRDIKPSNILVARDGTPKLLDFGIARLTQHEDGTLTRNVLTPYYASPEQVTGQAVTTASDIYSLGVLAYELLTGVGPYRGVTPDSSPLAVLQAIRDEEPERPSISKRIEYGRIDSEIDAILLKALHKVPSERYASADQFAADIQHYLHGEPVTARAASRAYLLRKFVRRHWAAVSAAAMTLVVLAAAAGVSIRQARIAEHERQLAERRFGDLRQLANSFVFEFDEAIRDTPGTTAARKLVIERSLQYLEQLARDARHNVTLERELAAAYQRIGDVLGNPYRPNLGDRPAAMINYRRALQLREQIAGRAGADNADRLALSESVSKVGEMQWALGEFAAAHDTTLRARDLAVACAAADPRPAHRYAAAVAHYRVGQALTKLGRFTETRQPYESARAALGLSAQSPREHRRLAAAATMKIADNVLRDGDRPAALAMYRDASDTLATLIREEPSSAVFQRTHAYMLNREALAQAISGDLALGRRLSQQAFDTQRRLAAADPNDRQVQGDVALSLSTLGALDARLGRDDTAAQHLSESIRLYESIAAAGASFVDQTSERAMTWRRLAELRLASGDRRGAREAAAAATGLLDRRDREYAPEWPLIGRVIRSAGAPAAGTHPPEGVAGVSVWIMDLGPIGAPSAR